MDPESQTKILEKFLSESVDPEMAKEAKLPIERAIRVISILQSRILKAEAALRGCIR